MNITVINGTEIKGCTYRMKEIFLKPLRENNTITEFYLPKDMPHFCCGCKNCFLVSTDKCPHVKSVHPIWSAILCADLLVFATPVYSLSIPGALKALLDRFCVHWMVHRPKPAMFTKQAVILSNSIAPSFMAKASQKDIVVALSWMGVSKIHRLGIGLMEGIVWDELSARRRANIERKVSKLVSKLTVVRPTSKGLKVRLKFAICKMMHNATAKNENPLSADNQYWLEHGWLKNS